MATAQLLKIDDKIVYGNVVTQIGDWYKFEVE
jgi:hypothetical protein